MSTATSATMNFPRRDARDKLRGRTRYTVDQVRPRMLHAALARAQVPSARIVRIDVSVALAMPGVRAVATATDAPIRHGIGIADHPLFATDRIRYDGEPIAAIAAETLAQAQAAAAALVVELEPLPAAISMADALAPGAPLVHPEWRDYEVLLEGAARGGNVAWEATVVRGDVDLAFARPDVEIVESTFHVGRQNHLALEPRAVIAAYEDGRFHIQTSTQVPWSIKNATARFLNVPPSDVRVTVPPVGGGFGLKFDWALEPFAALLARAAGRPVRL
jgi:CO/xanthine dehydrogenase Mo-binding subunit